MEFIVHFIVYFNYFISIFFSNIIILYPLYILIIIFKEKYYCYQQPKRELVNQPQKKELLTQRKTDNKSLNKLK